MLPPKWYGVGNVRRSANGSGKLPPMTTINRRIAASIEGDFVVFIIGARFNRWWKLPKYFWFLSTMPKMLKEVAARPESGFLGWEALGLTTNMQYWRSLEHLTAYSRDRDQTHYPYWVRFKRIYAAISCSVTRFAMSNLYT